MAADLAYTPISLAGASTTMAKFGPDRREAPWIAVRTGYERRERSRSASKRQEGFYVVRVRLGDIRDPGGRGWGVGGGVEYKQWCTPLTSVKVDRPRQVTWSMGTVWSLCLGLSS